MKFQESEQFKAIQSQCAQAAQMGLLAPRQRGQADEGSQEVALRGGSKNDDPIGDSAGDQRIKRDQVILPKGMSEVDDSSSSIAEQRENDKSGGRSKIVDFEKPEHERTNSHHSTGAGKKQRLEGRRTLKGRSSSLNLHS